MDRGRPGREAHLPRRPIAVLSVSQKPINSAVGQRISRQGIHANFRDYLSKGYRNAGVGAAGAVINWILLFTITQYLGLWYVYSEIIATFFAWFFNYNMNILLKVIRIEPSKPKARCRGSQSAKSAWIIRRASQRCDAA